MARPFSNLSPRERQVLKMIISGMRHKEIAAVLAVSTDTASKYLFRARQKLGFSSTAELIRWAVEQGILGRRPRRTV